MICQHCLTLLIDKILPSSDQLLASIDNLKKNVVYFVYFNLYFHPGEQSHEKTSYFFTCSYSQVEFTSPEFHN